jgi:hypothetical protein
VRREQPSILLLSRMIDYRIEQYGWPVSREDFVTKGKQYQEAFADFKYTFAEFKIVDTNTMFFYFSGHIEDQKRYDNSRKSDLNALGGHVKFFRVKDKFAWKIRMN